MKKTTRTIAAGALIAVMAGCGMATNPKQHLVVVDTDAGKNQQAGTLDVRMKDEAWMTENDKVTPKFMEVIAKMNSDAKARGENMTVIIPVTHGGQSRFGNYNVTRLLLRPTYVYEAIPAVTPNGDWIFRFSKIKNNAW
jgi:hypothetical protein